MIRGQQQGNWKILELVHFTTWLYFIHAPRAGGSSPRNYFSYGTFSCNCRGRPYSRHPRWIWIYMGCANIFALPVAKGLCMGGTYKISILFAQRQLQLHELDKGRMGI